MKKLLVITVFLAAGLFLASCSKKEKLELYLPNDYINTDLVDKFEKEYNVRVNVNNFNNNEIALGLMMKESFDLVVPSDYAIEELAAKGMLEEIDYKELLGADFEFAPGLNSFLTQLENDGFDFLKYAVPYFWGSVGILYRNDVESITKDRLVEEGFNIFTDSTLNTVIYDSSRDAFMAAVLATSGKALNDPSLTTSEIKEATEWLKSIKKRKNNSILSDEILDELLENNHPYDAIISYSGDAAYLITDNKHYDFFIPEKSNVWADGFVIPKNAENKELAKKFITFMNTYDSALANTEEIGYSSSRLDIFNEMITGDATYAKPREKYAYESNVSVFQSFRYNDEIKKLISDEWAIVLAS